MIIDVIRDIHLQFTISMGVTYNKSRLVLL